ncbi:hypothetical protein MED121_22607 [Marinomonas sp. MED121]|uniref:hypothetical protein n=1 Tax=Marinomonas sp. MED121 TaxID=314277 RepID=UPI000068FDDF|nr:hypothetical protein [Marinomonas sp. MED121]EAQ65511.1 hypothetical protein MED121_22607 [Marinomonas sp. MED121]
MNYIKKFNSLMWHDAKLLNIEIDRSNPGELDIIRAHIKWPNDVEEYLVFRDCYFADFKMNFGVISEETIFDAICSDNDPQILAVQEKWAPLGVELNKLLSYKINTNSTNSILKIYALLFEVE